MSEYQNGQFVRKEHGSIQHGVAVEYICFGYQFHIVATRTGVLIEGSLPQMPSIGARAVMQIIRRAIRQHEALNTPIGMKQTPISEEDLIAEEEIIAAEVEATKARLAPKPPNGDGPRLIVMPGGGAERV